MFVFHCVTFDAEFERLHIECLCFMVLHSHIMLSLRDCISNVCVSLCCIVI